MCLAVAMFGAAPSAFGDTTGVAVSGNIGLGAPAGLASMMARLDVGSAFIEADAGWGIAGAELGGGIGLTLKDEHSRTAKLGNTKARLTCSALLTRSRTSEREAGIRGGPVPELVNGAGTYYWGYLMTGGDIKLDSGLYILAEVGFVARLARVAEHPMDPAPDDVVSANIRAGVGFHF